MVILDTNIIIDHLRNSNESLLLKISDLFPKKDMAMSIISLQELYEGRSTKNSDKEEHMLATISPLKILPYTYEIAQLAGEISRDSKVLLEFADAAIAATAIYNGANLITLNQKHFNSIKNLELQSI